MSAERPAGGYASSSRPVSDLRPPSGGDEAKCPPDWRHDVPMRCPCYEDWNVPPRPLLWRRILARFAAASSGTQR